MTEKKDIKDLIQQEEANLNNLLNKIYKYKKHKGYRHEKRRKRFNTTRRSAFK